MILKPTRFVRPNKKRYKNDLVKARSFVLRKIIIMDLLKNAASAWEQLTKYEYDITYGYKNTLVNVCLSFESREFYHLAGFHYMRDVVPYKYRSSKMLDHVLNNRVTFDMAKKAQSYNDMVYPRLKALENLKQELENDFFLYTYLPTVYGSFRTTIRADYIIKTQGDFMFIIKASVPANDDEFHCCSIFEQGQRDYTENQQRRTILKKERIYLPTQEKTILFNKMT